MRSLVANLPKGLFFLLILTAFAPESRGEHAVDEGEPTLPASTVVAAPTIFLPARTGERSDQNATPASWSQSATSRLASLRRQRDRLMEEEIVSENCIERVCKALRKIEREISQLEAQTLLALNNNQRPDYVKALPELERGPLRKYLEGRATDLERQASATHLGAADRLARNFRELERVSQVTEAGKEAPGTRAPEKKVVPGKTASSGYRSLPATWRILEPNAPLNARTTRGALTKLADIKPGVAVYSHPANGDWTPNGGFGYNNRAGVNPKSDLLVVTTATTENPRTVSYLAGYIPADKVKFLKQMTPNQIAAVIKGDKNGGVQAPLTLLPPGQAGEVGVARLGTTAEARVSEALVVQAMLFPGVAEAARANPHLPADLGEKLQRAADVSRDLEAVAGAVGTAGAIRQAAASRSTASETVPDGVGGTHAGYGKVRPEAHAPDDIHLSPIDLNLKNVRSGATMSGNAVNKAYKGLAGGTTPAGNLDKAIDQGRYRSLIFDVGNASLEGVFRRILGRRPRPGQTRADSLIEGVNQDAFPKDTWYTTKETEPTFDGLMKTEPGQPPYRRLSDLMKAGHADCRARNYTLAEAMERSGQYESVHLVNRKVMTNGHPEQHTMVFYRQNGQWYVADAYFRQFNGPLSAFSRKQMGAIGRWNDPAGPARGEFQILADDVDRPMFMFSSGSGEPVTRTSPAGAELESMRE